MTNDRVGTALESFSALKEMTVEFFFFFFKEKPVGLTLKASISAPIVYDVCVFEISCTKEMETNYPRKNRDCIVLR